MRGTYEAFILVKVKDGSQYVCALNRQKQDQNHSKLKWLTPQEKRDVMEIQAIWN